MSRAFARPPYPTTKSFVPAACHMPLPGQAPWYPPVMVGADTLAAKLENIDYRAQALDLMNKLTPDEYTTYLKDFYAHGQRQYGADWRYADIVTVLLCLSEVLQPRTYLEIGVRRGRSACAVARKSPYVAMFLFDMWMANYAGMENPGPDFVKNELKKIGHKGPASFTDGDSHKTIPAFFTKNADAYLDIITVDGDHSEAGAAQDLCDVLPRLAIGGAVVFDDISHPAHPELNGVWKALVENDDRFSTFSYREAGYGVGFAIRKY
ncbi:MAG: class I SAM-dependent methyltransferase [Rhodospirillaceae bacterium]|nr:class I SAM-dependent methyltransferase [Rhodospirillaceae bacterium]